MLDILEDNLSRQKVTLLLGARRVGKTELLQAERRRPGHPEHAGQPQFGQLQKITGRL